MATIPDRFDSRRAPKPVRQNRRTSLNPENPFQNGQIFMAPKQGFFHFHHTFYPSDAEKRQQNANMRWTQDHNTHAFRGSIKCDE
jgi:hypothetical protein